MLAVGALFAVLGFLTCRPAAVCSGDVFLFLGFGLHLTFVRVVTFAATPKRNAVLQYFLKIVVHTFWLLLLANSQQLLMMEQAYARERHSDAVLVAGHDDVVVAD